MKMIITGAGKASVVFPALKKLAKKYKTLGDIEKELANEK